MSALLLNLQDYLAPVYFLKSFLAMPWLALLPDSNDPMSLHDRPVSLWVLSGFPGKLGTPGCQQVPLMAFYMGGPVINWQLIQGVTPKPVTSTVHLCSQQSLLHAGINRASGWLQQSAQLTLTLPSHFTITDSLVSCFANS